MKKRKIYVLFRWKKGLQTFDTGYMFGNEKFIRQGFYDKIPLTDVEIIEKTADIKRTWEWSRKFLRKIL